MKWMHRWKKGAVLGLLAGLCLAMSVTAQAQTPAEPYDLGQITIIQARFSPDSRFYEMPVQVRGVMAVPEGEGPFPVALFLHGAYPFCAAPLVNEADVYPCPEEDDLRQYEGFAYLAEGLARRGYIAIVPDLGAEYTFGYGEPVFGERGGQIVRAHLAALMGDRGLLAGLADMTAIYYIGHSRGAPLAISFFSETGAVPPAAFVMLTPAAAQPGYIIPAHVPVALVVAQCDGDVRIDEPRTYLESLLAPDRHTLTILYTLPGGTHNSFSNKLPPDFFPPEDCDGVDRMDGITQRLFAMQFVGDFFESARATTALINQETPNMDDLPASVLSDRPVVTVEVTYLARIALNPDSQITVQLLDTSLADAPAEVLATQTIRADGRNVPFTFELPYNPAALVENRTYTVRAEIRLNGDLIFTTDTAYPVLTGGNPAEATIILVPVG